MEFTADQVWGLAVRADTINEGYCKEAVWGYSDSGESKMLKTANKMLVKQWLRDNVQPTEEEVTQGQEYRKFFGTYTLKALTGQLSDFDRQALKIAQMDSFTGRNMLEFAVISCLPATARREQARTDFKRELYSSEQLVGNVGDMIVGEITVVSSRFNPNYNKFRVQARMGESFVDFWHGQELKGELKIKGKIKAVRGDKTTQLHYVKISG